MRKVKAAILILDYDLYPRNNIDPHNVRGIMDAIATGVELPPVIIDRKTKRVVDGFHRVRAWLRADPEAEVMVIEKSYKSDSDLFLDAMKYNAAHGARLDPCDRTRCVIIADRLHVPMDKVAAALHMPEQKLGVLRNDRIAKASDGLMIPLKRTNRHMAGRKLTKAQQEVNERSSGMNQVFYANQLIDLIESGLLDKGDGKLLERLRKLHELLESLLAAV